MSRLLRNSCVLLLICSPIVLAGCHQHPLATSNVGRQPAWADHPVVNVEAAVRIEQATQFNIPDAKAGACASKTDAPQSPKPKDEPPIAGVQKQPDGLTGQLADGIVLAFKAFTGRQ